MGYSHPAAGHAPEFQCTRHWKR